MVISERQYKTSANTSCFTQVLLLADQMEVGGTAAEAAEARTQLQLHAIC